MPSCLTNYQASFHCKVYYNQWKSVLTKDQSDVQQQSRRRYIELRHFINVGQDSIVSTVTRYVLDGSGFKKPAGAGVSTPSGTALDCTQPPIQQVLNLSCSKVAGAQH